MAKPFEGKMPPLKLWRDSGKHPPGPTELQRMYFIDKIPPEERPHLHPQDQIFSVGGQGSSKTYGGVIRLIDTCATVPGTVAYLGGMDFKLLKRNTWGTIQDVFTINEPWDHPAILNRLHDQNNELKFRNGSKLVCINLEQHLDKKIGYTAGIQMIDEVHLLPDVGAYNLIVGRNRGYPPEISQLIMCTNPQRSKEGWTNEQFELHRFEGIDTSEHPHQILIGNPCKCHFCTKCRLFKKKEIPWEQTGEDVYQCPACKSFRDFYTWKGKKYHCPGNQQYIRVIKSESGHNPHLRDDYFQGMEDAYDEVYFDIMVRGTVNVNLRDDYCYKKYDENIHELPLQIELNWNQDLYWGLDFNKKPQASVICQFEDIEGKERFVVKEEIRLSGKPTVEFPHGKGEGATSLDVAKYFVDKYKSRYKGTTIHVFGDPHAFTSTVTSSQNSFEIVCGYLEENGFHVNLVADNHQISVKDRLELVDYWLEQEFILFNPPSIIPWTTKSFKESKLDENDEGKGEKVSKKQDWNAARSTNMNKVYCTSHFNEALGYLIWKLFPMVGEDLRSATLPDGTTIREDRRGKVVVEKFQMDKAPEPGSWESLLTELKKKEENPTLAPDSLKDVLNVSFRATQYSDDDGR